MENEYQPKCGDALWLGSKGRCGSFHLWVNVWVAGKTCDPSLRRAIPEHFRDESLYSAIPIYRYFTIRPLSHSLKNFQLGSSFFLAHSAGLSQEKYGSQSNK